MTRPLIDRIEEARASLYRQSARIEKARSASARSRASLRMYKASEKLEALEAKDRAIDEAAKWNGLCDAGKHGLDFKGQPCDLCPEVLP